MATNSIGAGRTNVSVPLWDDEAALLHHFAGQTESRVELVRKLILEGARAKYPALARQIEAIRYAAKAAVVVVLVGLGVGAALMAEATGQGLDHKRTSRRFSRVEIVARKREEV